MILALDFLLLTSLVGIGIETKIVVSHLWCNLNWEIMFFAAVT